jgi:hypothetical protein
MRKARLSQLSEGAAIHVHDGHCVGPFNRQFGCDGEVSVDQDPCNLLLQVWRKGVDLEEG